MIVKRIAISLYALFGSLFVIAGASVLLQRTGPLPDAVGNVILGVTKENPNTLHIAQEFGSLLVFAGLITFWFIRHYQQSLAFHWAMTTFWLLFAVVHWLDARGDLRSIAVPMINTVPLILFTLIGLVRRWSVSREALT
jgi:hypothetical protein